MAEPSPHFDHPPVVETVLGVQFAPLEGYTGGHAGVFWRNYLGDDWPHAADAPALPDQQETFGGPPILLTPGMSLSFGVQKVPIAQRLQIFNRARDRMVQVQPTRFHYNWSKAGGMYPSYHKVRAEFDQHYCRFLEFVAAEKFGPVIPNQWELSYIDYIPPGDLCRSPADWGNVIPGLLGLPGADDLVRLENTSGEWHFEIVPQRGRLHVNASLGMVTGQSQAGLLLQWTARGPIRGGVDLDSGLKLGHDVTIQTFLKVTSAEAKTAWGIKK